MPVFQLNKLASELAELGYPCRAGTWSDVKPGLQPYFERWLKNRDGFVTMERGSIDYIGIEEVVRMGPFYNIYFLVASGSLADGDSNAHNLVDAIPYYQLRGGKPANLGWSGGVLSTLLAKDADNTDAEGRMILADALAYGIATYNPKAVIDLATLTGAAIIALGSNVAALIGNNKQLTDRVRRMAEKSGERMWDLPLYDEFHEQIKSSYADIKNIGGRPGGAITAAAFLSNFVNGVPWVHMDIAGTAWTQDGTYERSYNPKGATGFGIRTLVKLLMEEEKPQQQQQQQASQQQQ